MIVAAFRLAAVLAAGLLPISYGERASPLRATPPPTAAAASLPRVMLWAWERPEDLRFLNPREAGVAFLARTVFLSGNSTFVRPRLQPLAVAPGTSLVAVVRIETNRAAPPALSPAQRDDAVRAIAAGASMPGISSLQIDFDAKNSERNFYRALLTDLRAQLPATMPIAITALASWCISDNWLESLPIDDAIPMLFRMGPDRSNVFLYLAAGRDFRAGACRQSVGVSTDEPLPRLPGGRRVYAFHPRAWSPDAARKVVEELNQWQ